MSILEKIYEASLTKFAANSALSSIATVPNAGVGMVRRFAPELRSKLLSSHGSKVRNFLPAITRPSSLSNIFARSVAPISSALTTTIQPKSECLWVGWSKRRTTNLKVISGWVPSRHGSKSQMGCRSTKLGQVRMQKSAKPAATPNPALKRDCAKARSPLAPRYATFSTIRGDIRCI